MKKGLFQTLPFWKYLKQEKGNPEVSPILVDEFPFPDEYEDYSEIDDMRGAIENIMAQFSVSEDAFNYDVTFQLLVEYYLLYDRMLYNLVTQEVLWAYQKTNDIQGGIDDSVVQRMIFNIRALLSDVLSDYRTPHYMVIVDDVINKSGSCPNAYLSPEELFIKAKKSLYKILDFTELAQLQWKKIQSLNIDQEKSIKESVESSSNDLEKDLTKRLTSQLVTLVGIFTALAFLLFGGIDLGAKFVSSGVDGGAVLSFPITKMLCIVALWGLALLNIVFVFLYCVGQMTDLDFKAAKEEDASFFQKYPVFIWSNFILLNVLLICGFLYFCFNNGDIQNPFITWAKDHIGWTSGLIKMYIVVTAITTFIFRYKTKVYSDDHKSLIRVIAEYYANSHS